MFQLPSPFYLNTRLNYLEIYYIVVKYYYIIYVHSNTLILVGAWLKPSLGFYNGLNVLHSSKILNDNHGVSSWIHIHISR